MMIQTSAPAKLILFGEHAVVYGYPAIAVPVSSLRATATVYPGETDSGLQIDAVDLNKRLPVNLGADSLDDALTLTARLTWQALSITAPPNMEICVQSDIPVASGLGSGAAVSACLARAIVEAAGRTITLEQINQLVYEAEKLHHGTPSGIDNTVVVYEQPIVFVREQPIEFLKIPEPFDLMVGDTGVKVPTRVPVGDVRVLVEEQPERMRSVLDAIGQIGREARATILSGGIEALGPLMNRNHALLQQLTVSSPILDRLVAAAIDAGALGAKLSGGGRGGTMIALVRPDQIEVVRKALTDAGAVRVFHTTVQ